MRNVVRNYQLLSPDILRVEKQIKCKEYMIRVAIVVVDHAIMIKAYKKNFNKNGHLIETLKELKDLIVGVEREVENLELEKLIETFVDLVCNSGLLPKHKKALINKIMLDHFYDANDMKNIIKNFQQLLPIILRVEDQITDNENLDIDGLVIVSEDYNILRTALDNHTNLNGSIETLEELDNLIYMYNFLD